MKLNHIYQGDALEVLKTFPDESVDMCITSPPYWALRDYGVKGQLGLEPTFQDYINNLLEVFKGVKRVLKKGGSVWVNIGDTYGGGGMGTWKSKTSTMGKQVYTIPYGKNMSARLNGSKYQKSLIQIPSRFAIGMTDKLGYILRNEIIWHKPNAMPSSAKDRFTVDFEKIYFFTKSRKYYFDQQFEPYNKPLNRWGGEKLKDKGMSKKDLQGAYRDRNLRPNPKGRNKRCVWSINTKGFPGDHFAVYPEKLIETPIKAGCPKNGIVLDPFMGSGTTAVVAKKLGRNYVGIELNPEYIKIAEARIKAVTQPLL